jgi:hypothetical protein
MLVILDPAQSDHSDSKCNQLNQCNTFSQLICEFSDHSFKKVIHSKN